jgi:hypothetical protein
MYYEKEVREFAKEFPGPNTQQLLRYASQGQITWREAYEIAKKAVADGLSSVSGTTDGS